MTETHTPTPFTLGARDEDTNTLPIIAGRIGTPMEDYVAMVCPRPFYADNQCANAEFIIRACNAHADLVAALWEIPDLTAGVFDGTLTIHDNDIHKIEAARVAIAKATG